MTVIKTSSNNDYVLKIYQDSDSRSPREWDNLGTMVCWHNRYNLGDDHNYESPREWLEDMVRESKDYSDEYIEQLNDHQLTNIVREDCILLPLYLYDHSGLSMNTTGFSCGWDSGQVGYIYVKYEDVMEQYSNIVVDRVESNLKSEVETYSSYIGGDVYGYEIETIEGEHVDSCWGFYGLDNIEQQISDMGYKDLVNNLDWAS